MNPAILTWTKFAVVALFFGIVVLSSDANAQRAPTPASRTQPKQTNSPQAASSDGGQRPTAPTAPTAPSGLPEDVSLVDVQEARPPTVLQAEAHAGRPYGIGKISFRLNPGDEMISRTGAVFVSDAGKRIRYPIISNTPFRKFLQNFIPNRGLIPGEAQTIWFLFEGDQPLDVTLHGTGKTTFQIPIVFDRPRRYQRFADNWWRSFSSESKDQANARDYPPMVEAYLTSLIGKRLGLTKRSAAPPKKDPLAETFELLFDVQSLRIDGIKTAMSTGVDRSIATLPLPEPIAWTPLVVENLPAEIEIEPLVKSVPHECFYLRFGTWDNQIWLQRLTEEFGGDLGRMIQLSGYQARIQSKFLDQLAIQSSEFDRLFGGNLIDDVGVIGTDVYVDNGASIGVMLHARDTRSLKRNLSGKRKSFAKQHADQNCQLSQIETAHGKISRLSTPDNRYRSFYAVAGDNHLITTSLSVAQRFLEASAGIGSLADSAEFKFARYTMPLDRDDTLFIYMPTEFFKNLLTPKYQVEVRRRNQVVTDMVLSEMAKLAANAESYSFRSDDDLIKGGYLPKHFGNHPDGSRFETNGQHWTCTLRGRRGFFTPIADIDISRVTQQESEWFNQRARFFADSIQSMDPMVVAVKRYQQKGKIERIVFDARILPFGQQKYAWLLNRIGPPLNNEVKASQEDIIRFDVSLRGGSRGSVATHHLFGAVQDYLAPNIDLTPESFFRTLDTVRQTPGYVGAWPNPGYTDWMPQLGGRPDALGYTYSQILDLWRLQWNDFSILSFDRQRLEQLKPNLEVVPSERPAQIRLKVGDLVNSKIKAWANTLNFRRSWQASIANVRLMNTIKQQFHISLTEAQQVTQRLLDVDLVCSLGGEYRQARLPSGRNIMYSSAWPSFPSPTLPQQYVAPLLTWFRGLEVEFIKNEKRFSIHGILDIQRSRAASSLPSFDLFEGFGGLFGGKQKKSDKSPNQK